MKEYIHSQIELMIEQLETLVNIDSGSHDKEGIDRVGNLLQDWFSELGYRTEVFADEQYGDSFLLSYPDATPDVLLLAHMDTVFAKGTVAARPFGISGDRAYGPGVIDMKGSHISMLYALKALLEHGGEQAVKHTQILFTSDEEIGAPSSRNIIERVAEGKKAVLVMEPARKDGSLVTFRRGGGRFVLNIKGIAAHSGINPEEGSSAIEALARKTTELHALSDHENGVSVNVGIISGGTTVNTVAEHAHAEIDLRISSAEQGPVLTDQITAICNKESLDGTKATVTGGIGRPPMERNEQTVQLLALIQQAGEEIGLHVTEVGTGGSSDASFTSAMGIPTIDGMGPVGGGAHSSEEYLELPTLPERTHLLAEVLLRLAK
ncbi:M20 family metallopeptidase [Geomicrobium sp. JSM 1781026]|uniref:M20 family metallopeptidase n=1 Tax=Geomicrobium sp. JSM 1781026 TaxID=3344580 RepID=UPI0035C0B16F